MSRKHHVSRRQSDSRHQGIRPEADVTAADDDQLGYRSPLVPAKSAYKTLDPRCVHACLQEKAPRRLGYARRALPRELRDFYERAGKAMRVGRRFADWRNLRVLQGFTFCSNVFQQMMGVVSLRKEIVLKNEKKRFEKRGGCC